MKRLLLAVFTTLAVEFLLGLLSSYATQQGVVTASPTTPGYTDPLSCMVLSIAYCIGGLIAGRRFIAVAFAITIVRWIVGIHLLTKITAPVSLEPFTQTLTDNGLQIALSTLAVVTGAAVGAWWQSRFAQAQTV